MLGGRGGRKRGGGGEEGKSNAWTGLGEGDEKEGGRKVTTQKGDRER